MNLARKPLALFAALALSLAVAGPAFAASSASSDMTLTVGNSITVANVPTTLDFDTALAGGTASAPAFTPTLTASSPATFTASATALDRTGGGDSIPSTAVEVNGNAVPHVIYSGTSYAGGALTVTIEVPLSILAGTYTGTFTIAGS